MRLEIHDFRHALPILERSYPRSWKELREQLSAMSAADITNFHRGLVRAAIAAGRRPQAGAQTAINRLIDARLQGLSWTAQPPLYLGGDRRGDALAGWKMDFKKQRVGVEIAFNHQEAIPWIFTRLNLAGESTEVLPDSRIDVGVAVFAAQSLKTWGKMDAAVGTFYQAKLWLEKMRPVMPVPVLVIGLHAESDEGRAWSATDAFRGTLKGRAYGKRIEEPQWHIAEDAIKGAEPNDDR